MKKRFFIAIVIACMCVSLLSGCGQAADLEDRITVKHSAERIEALTEVIYTQTVYGDPFYLGEFKRQYDAEYLQETYQGCYGVLLQEDGQKVYVFFNEEQEAYSIYVKDHFKTKDDFAIEKIGHMTMKQVEEYDKPYYGLPDTMGVITTLHLVQEGLCVITYAQKDTREESVVDTVDFFSNRDVLKNDDYIFFREAIPFIKEEDRMIG